MKEQRIKTEIDQAIRIALQHHQAGRFATAETLYRQVLAQQPNHSDALNLLGILTQRAGNNTLALKLIRQAIASNPDIAEYHDTLSNVLREGGVIEEAIAAARQAVRLKPDNPKFHNNLGNALRDSRLLDEAIIAYRRALQINPRYPEAHSNLGIALRDKGSFEDAIANYRQAIRLKPDLAQAYCGLGVALKSKGQLDDAIASYLEAIRLKPDLAEAHSNLGNALKEIGQLDRAIASYRRAIQLNPRSAHANSDLLFALHLDPAADPASIFAEHRTWAERHAGPQVTSVIPLLNDRSPKRRLRIGYVSADFRKHSVAYFFQPLLEQHDRTHFEIICYSNVQHPDEITQQIKHSCDAWHDITALADEAAVKLIRSHGVDILVDLSGHTSGNRLTVFAQKPASIQVTYLGYPNTSGMPAIDYRLTDALADPLGTTDQINTETLWRLTGCAWCFQPPGKASEIQPRSSGPITFGSFSSFSKINPNLMQLWAEVLKRVPQSRLVLKSDGAGQVSAQRELIQQFEGHGIGGERLTMLGRTESHLQHLQSYHQLDIALDTFPYNGTTTTCETLWMGIPFITLAGQSHVSRVGVSVLTNAGLPELIAETPEQYVSIAIELANDPERLRHLRSTLRKRMKTLA